MLRVANSFDRYSPLEKSEGNWDELTFTKTTGTFTRDWQTKRPELTCAASPVTIPETIAGRISVPVSFLFLTR